MTETDHRSHGILRPLALLALGRTGADIERLVREVRRTARRSGRDMEWADVDAALREGHKALSGDYRRRVAIHEAGHALVYTLTGIAAVQSASLGIHEVGMVTVIANRQRPQSEGWLMDNIACLLAGRVAEQRMLGNAVAGCGGATDSDLARATELAVSAETALGFSAYQPLLYRPVVMGANTLTYDRDLADRVNRRLEQAEAMALKMIDENLQAFEAIAEGLERVGILSGDEVRRIVRPSVQTSG